MPTPNFLSGPGRNLGFHLNWLPTNQFRYQCRESGQKLARALGLDRIRWLKLVLVNPRVTIRALRKVVVVVLFVTIVKGLGLDGCGCIVEQDGTLPEQLSYLSHKSHATVRTLSQHACALQTCCTLHKQMSRSSNLSPTTHTWSGRVGKLRPQQYNETERAETIEENRCKLT